MHYKIFLIQLQHLVPPKRLESKNILQTTRDPGILLPATQFWWVNYHRAIRVKNTIRHFSSSNESVFFTQWLLITPFARIGLLVFPLVFFLPKFSCTMIVFVHQNHIFLRQTNALVSTNHTTFFSLFSIEQIFLRFDTSIDVHFSSRLFVHLCGCEIFTMDLKIVKLRKKCIA